MRRYYELLDLSEDADEAAIKNAYRRKARETHPDRNPDDPDAAKKFQEVKEAYECLSDPERKQAYDERGDTSIRTSNPAEDLFFHLVNQVTDHFETACEVLLKLRSVIDEMVNECDDRKLKTDQRIRSLEKMTKSLRFKGKGVNLLEGVLTDKLTKLRHERSELDAATQAAKLVYDMIKEYDATDRPRGPTVESQQEALMRKFDQTLKGFRPGGWRSP